MSIRRFLTTTALAALASWLASAEAQAGYTFQNVINPADVTFNQLLGVNNSGLITGYFGSGAVGFPNQGYTYSGGGAFTSTNFPGSTQTQVTGLNNNGTLVGFWAPTNMGGDANYGFYEQGGVFSTVVNPNTTSAPPVNQLLGVNDSNVAVGFYNDNNNNAHGYTYNITTGTFTPVISTLPNVASLTAAGINNAGDIVGFYSTVTGGPANGFLDIGGTFTTLDAPGSTSTMLLGVNNKGLIVGTDTDANGMHGVIYNELTQSWTVLDAFGTNANFTTFNGLNDLGQIVGFYTTDGGNGNTIGLLVSAPAPEAGKGLLGLALLVLAGAAARARGLPARFSAD